jgi:hypothetical protein
MKMDVYSISLGGHMEIGQRYMVNYLQRKGMELAAIVAELAAV